LLIDTHCHIDLLIADFDTIVTEDMFPLIQKIITESEANAVTQMITVGTNRIDSKNGVTISRHFSSIFASIGIHPTDWHDNYKKDLDEFLDFLKTEKKVVAIGECGLDLYHKKINLEKQIKLFHDQIELAISYQKPLIIHSRNSYDQTLKILEYYRNEKLSGVVHCFSYDYDFARTVIEWNFLVGIGGTITYPANNQLRNAITKIPLSSIVLETDSPYLPIQSMRGKKNHPNHIHDIAVYIAHLRSTSLQTISQETTHNASKLFNLI